MIEELDEKENGDLKSESETEGIKWFVMIGREQEMQAAVERCKCDVLIVQGCEAGGMVIPRHLLSRLCSRIR